MLQSLVEPRFFSADKNISETPGQILRPDLVLEDENSGAFIIVELKRSRNAAREFATELLAYANCLVQLHPGSQVFFVLVSTSWAPLEQLALAELAQRNFPVLGLEYREEGHGEATPTLWVRSDLLPITSVKSFPPRALLVDTKVFWLPANWWMSNSALWLNRIEHAVSALIREAERGRASGFVIVWHQPYESPSPGRCRAEVRVFVSMVVRTPCRPPKRSSLKSEQKVTEFTWSDDGDELLDDTGVRLLLNLELGKNIQYYSSERDGTWDNLRERLEHENVCVLRFDGFGEIGDQVSSFRTQRRHVLRPVVPDMAAFPAWHPITWLSALESLIDLSEQEEVDRLAWHAFHCGENLSKLRESYLVSPMNRHFGKTMAQARFALTWSYHFATLQDSPKLRTRIDASGFCLNRISLEAAISFALWHFEEDSELAGLCFSLGCYAGSGVGDVRNVVSQRRELLKKGIHFPRMLDERIDKLESKIQACPYDVGATDH